MDDILNKLEIVKNVFLGFDKPENNLSPDGLFEMYTGYESNPSLATQKVGFQDYLDIKDKAPELLENLRKILVKWYLNDGKVPKIDDIDITFEGNLSVDEYFYTLAHYGFVWKNIPGTPKAIFIEKYSNIAKRLQYLIKMRQYRKEGCHIVYLEDCTYKKNVKAKSFIGVSNKHGVVSLVRMSPDGEFKNYDYQESGLTIPSNEWELEIEANPLPCKLKPLVSSTNHISDFQGHFLFKSECVKYQVDWIKEHILKVTTEPCVFVFEGLPFTNHDMMGPYTAKADLKEYLDRHGVPHAHRAHRFELYQLVKKFTPPTRDLFSDVIKAYGHEYIQVPYGLNSLSFFHWFWPEDGKEEFTQERIRSAEKNLISMENVTFNEDRMMEEVIDKLMTLGKYEGKVDDDLTDYIDVLKYDLEYGHNSMFVH